GAAGGAASGGDRGGPLKRAGSSRVAYVGGAPRVGQESARDTGAFHAVPPWTRGAKTREKLAGLSAARAASDGKTNVPSWLGVWFWSRPVPLNRAPSLGRCAPPPGSQESSSLSSRLRLSTRCGKPALPPKA